MSGFIFGSQINQNRGTGGTIIGGGIGGMLTGSPSMTGIGAIMGHGGGSEGPDKLPAVPKQQEPSPMAAQPKAPGNAPGQDDNTTGAGAADEKRRIMKAMPSRTKNTFAGNTSEAAQVKKRVLGGATGGRRTTGE